jgi:hypothetical protein
MAVIICLNVNYNTVPIGTQLSPFVYWQVFSYIVHLDFPLDINKRGRGEGNGAKERIILERRGTISWPLKIYI